MRMLISSSCAFMILVAASAPPAQAGHQLELGAAFLHVDYEEDCPPPLKSTEKDWLPGFHGMYGYRGEELPLQAAIRLEYTRGATAYDGTNQQGAPLRGDTFNSFFTTEFTMGYRLNSQKAASLSPYLGIGYKHRDRDLGAYREEYSWKYVPLGLLVETRFSSTWTAALDVAVHLVFDSRIKARLSDIQPLLQDADADLGNKTGYRLALPLTYHPGHRWGLALTPWYEHSALGRSETFPLLSNGTIVGHAYEPDSRTRQLGIRLGLRRTF